MYPLNLPPLQILHLSSQLLWAGLILLLVGLVAA
ncbi:MAG: transmembrane sensor/regulator PpyR, partial [Pseudomonas sp.]|nr:transmembrane sensor/regulator PpyR [Pseudomonas sp.]